MVDDKETKSVLSRREGPPELYIVETDRFEPQKEGAKIIQTDYRVLARSVVEAVEIVEQSCDDRDEIVRAARYASHITGLRANRFKIVPVVPLGPKIAEAVKHDA